MAVFLVSGTIGIRAAIERGKVLIHKLWVDVAARVGHLGKGGWIARNHRHAGCRCHKDKPTGACRVLQSKVLRHGAAPRNAHDIHLAKAEAAEQFSGDPAHGEGVVRDHRIGRFARTGHVEHDETALWHCLCQRGNGLDIGANTIEEKNG